MIKRTIFFALCLLAAEFSTAQDTLLTRLAGENLKTFTKSADEFSGEGWTSLLAEVKESNHILIGEDHCFHEVPIFTSALAKAAPFDNFICEIDPFSADILSEKIRSLSETELNQYQKEFGNTFSFFAMQSEFDLMEELVKGKTKILGTDQIIGVADRLICSELKKMTSNEEARQIYLDIENQSKAHFDRFLQNKGEGDFFMDTEAFAEQLKKLAALDLSQKEQAALKALQMSIDIYGSRSHKLRIQLMKHQLMQAYEQIVSARNLYKYGAMHSSKGESFLTIYDIGNLVSNLADSQFGSSLHIMILGKSGTQGSPFKGFPSSEVNPEKSMLRPIMPFFRAVSGEEWHCFDLRPIAKFVAKGELEVDNKFLLRMIKGYDYLVIAPEMTAAKFPE